MSRLVPVALRMFKRDKRGALAAIAVLSMPVSISAAVPGTARLPSACRAVGVTP
jgi:hypothetical protein